MENVANFSIDMPHLIHLYILHPALCTSFGRRRLQLEKNKGSCVCIYLAKIIDILCINKIILRSHVHNTLILLIYIFGYLLSEKLW